MIHQPAKTFLRVLLSHSNKNQAIPGYTPFFKTSSLQKIRDFPMSSYRKKLGFVNYEDQKISCPSRRG